MKRLLRSDGFDVIVVGSGLAGLSAALTVAEFGYSPVILEKACEPGGLTRRAIFCSRLLQRRGRPQADCARH